MRILVPLLLIGCASAPVAHFSPAAGWTAAAGSVAASDAEDAIRGAADVAIVQLAQHGDRCMNSVADAMTARLVEGVRGDAPASAAAVDRHTGFGAIDGYLVAAVEPRAASIEAGDECTSSVSTPATIVAFVSVPDLDSARAEARRLVLRYP